MTYLDRDGTEREELDTFPDFHAIGCRDGWTGEDHEGRPIPCPRCRPHLIRTSGGWTTRRARKERVTR